MELVEAYESAPESHSTASFPWKWQTALEGVEILQLNSVETGLETQNQLKEKRKKIQFRNPKKEKKIVLIVPGKEDAEPLVEDGRDHEEAPVELHKTGPDTTLAEAPPEKTKSKNQKSKLCYLCK